MRRVETPRAIRSTFRACAGSKWCRIVAILVLAHLAGCAGTGKGDGGWRYNASTGRYVQANRTAVARTRTPRGDAGDGADQVRDTAKVVGSVAGAIAAGLVLGALAGGAGFAELCSSMNR